MYWIAKTQPNPNKFCATASFISRGFLPLFTSFAIIVKRKFVDMESTNTNTLQPSSSNSEPGSISISILTPTATTSVVAVETRNNAAKPSNRIPWRRRLPLWILFFTWTSGLLYVIILLAFLGADEGSLRLRPWDVFRVSACKPDGSFTLFYSRQKRVLWTKDGIFQVTLGIGKLSFAQAKIIDVAWDLTKGCGTRRASHAGSHILESPRAVHISVLGPAS
ncbi:hypothetical protein QBC43DRAFT_303728, partial [Cladorrhinum sp. PSN259]